MISKTKMSMMCKSINQLQFRIEVVKKGREFALILPGTLHEAPLPLLPQDGVSPPATSLRYFLLLKATTSFPTTPHGSWQYFSSDFTVSLVCFSAFYWKIRFPFRGGSDPLSSSFVGSCRPRWPEASSRSSSSSGPTSASRSFGLLAGTELCFSACFAPSLHHHITSSYCQSEISGGPSDDPFFVALLSYPIRVYLVKVCFWLLVAPMPSIH